VDIVAIVALGCSVEQEAPRLAADLGLTVYEVALALRGPTPIIVLRTEDRLRSTQLLASLRSRGHDATAFEGDAVAASETMFRPKAFRFEGASFVGVGKGEERVLPLSDIFALIRATHARVEEDTVTSRERRLSFGRAVMTGGMLMTKRTTTESKQVSSAREAVAYVFRNDGPPWLLVSTELQYGGLGPEMRRSQVENFEVLVNHLKGGAKMAAFDARLLSVRPSPSTIVASSGTHVSTSSSATVDVLAHIVAMTLSRTARPYR
jgi:hypothetical protein